MAYFSAVFIVVMSLFFLWVVFWPSRGSDRAVKGTKDEQSRRAATLTGLLGGSVEDAAKAKFMLDRSGAEGRRSEATAVAMQREVEP